MNCRNHLILEYKIEKIPMGLLKNSLQKRDIALAPKKKFYRLLHTQQYCSSLPMSVALKYAVRELVSQDTNPFVSTER